jgi:glycerate-2-kinase
MALAAARPISTMPDTCFLASGTDGTDGPTDAAGALVDPDSLSRAQKAGFSDSKSLTQNDSYHYLESCEGLIKTGPTGSNVTDLVLVVNVHP